MKNYSNELDRLAKNITEIQSDVGPESALNIVTASTNKIFKEIFSTKVVNAESQIVNQVEVEPIEVLMTINSELEIQKDDTEYKRKKRFNNSRKWYLGFILIIGTLFLFEFISNTKFDPGGKICRNSQIESEFEHPIAKVNRLYQPKVECRSASLTTPESFVPIWLFWMLLYIGTEGLLYLMAAKNKFKKYFPGPVKIAVVAFFSYYYFLSYIT